VFDTLENPRADPFRFPGKRVGECERSALGKIFRKTDLQRTRKETIKNPVPAILWAVSVNGLHLVLRQGTCQIAQIGVNCPGDPASEPAEHREQADPRCQPSWTHITPTG